MGVDYSSGTIRILLFDVADSVQPKPCDPVSVACNQGDNHDCPKTGKTHVAFSANSFINSSIFYLCSSASTTATIRLWSLKYQEQISLTRREIVEQSLAYVPFSQKRQYGKCDIRRFFHFYLVVLVVTKKLRHNRCGGISVIDTSNSSTRLSSGKIAKRKTLQKETIL